MKRKRWESLRGKKRISGKTDEAFYQLPNSQPMPAVGRGIDGSNLGGNQKNRCTHYGGSSAQFEVRGIDAPSVADDVGAIDSLNACDEQIPLPQDDREANSCDSNKESIGYMERENPVIPLCWTALASLLFNTGTKRFTEEHYGVFAGYINWLSPSEKLPSVSAVKRTVRPCFRSAAFVKMDTKSFSVDLRKSGAKPGVRRHRSENECPVHIVKPSEWAKADLATECIEKLVTKCSRRDHLNAGDDVPYPIFSSIEDAPIVRDRMKTLETFKIRKADRGYCDLTAGVQLEVDIRDTFDVRQKASQVGFRPRLEGDNIRVSGRVESLHVSEIIDEDISKECGERDSEACSRGMKIRKSRKKTKKKESPPFRAGDVVVHLATLGTPQCSEEMEERSDNTYEAYVVFRCWIRERTVSDFRLSVVFLQSGCKPETWNRAVPYTRELVRDVTAVSSTEGDERNLTPEEDYSRNSSAPHGTLQDGRSYVVYRFLLYSDGFTPKRSCSGSMGGCYMLPLGISPDDRSAVGAIRRLSLTPSGVSTNEVIKFIIEDIVKGTVEGFTTKDSKGREVVIFLDCVGFIADYPAISETMDVLGHTSNVPCHLCFFSRYDKSGSGSSKYGYTTEVHCGHPSFCRNEARLCALRKVGIPDEELRRLGMDSNDSFETRVNALHELSIALKQAREQVPLTVNGSPVVPSMFDTYRSSIIAPDHLFLGLGMDVLNCALTHLPPKIRKDAEHYAKDALKGNDLIYQNHLLNQDGTSVNSMQISAMYSFLLVAPYAFRTAWKRGLDMYDIRMTGTNREHVEAALGLLDQFQRLVGTTQYQPAACVDGMGDVDWYNRDGGQSRLNELRDSALKYIGDINDLWKRSGKAKDLDKPNIHRLLEFYIFTLPNFGSVKLIEELVLENAHQDMKKGVAQSNFQNAQLQSMEHALANDWVNRLAVEVEDIHIDGSNWTSSHFRSVLRLLGRPEWERQTFDNVTSQIRSMFPPPTLQMLKTRRRTMSSLIHRRVGWEVGPRMPRSNAEADERTTLREDVTGALHYLYEMMRSDIFGDDIDVDCEVREHTSANWLVRYGSVDKITRRITTITFGSVIQSLTTFPERIRPQQYMIDVEAPQGSSDARRMFWVVVALFSTVTKSTTHMLDTPNNGKSIYALVLPCETNDRHFATVDCRQRARILIKLSENVRRVMALHCCSEDYSRNGSSMSCIVAADGERVEHTPSLLEGGTYEIYGRKEGFPPRSG